MRVLGLSFSGHGSAICLVEDGRIVAAVEPRASHSREVRARHAARVHARRSPPC